MVNMSELFEFDQIARKNVAEIGQKRDLFHELANDKGRHFTGIIGPRGVGKTILLKQLAVLFPESVYFSAEILNGSGIFEVIKLLIEKYTIKVVCIDEIHLDRNYKESLKKIYDAFKVKIFFTSSVVLSLSESSIDLSRRVRLYSLYPFTFREYVKIKIQLELPRLTLQDILNKNWTSDYMKVEYLFNEYLEGGLMPFSLEESNIFPLLSNVIEKVLNQDIPCITDLKIDEINLIRRCIEFIARSPVDGVNYSSVSRNIGITKYKAEHYIRLLEKAFILNPLFPVGKNVSREPKVLMCLPYRLLYNDYSQVIGALREDFFVESMRFLQVESHYLKSTRGVKTPDYQLHRPEGELIVEIGGKGKGRNQFKGIEGTKALILTHPSQVESIKRPLFLIGFL